MLCRNPDSRRRDKREHDEASLAATKASLVIADLTRLNTLLEMSEKRGDSKVDAFAEWSRVQGNLIAARYQQILEAQLPWWCYLRNPLWATVFSIARRRFQVRPIDDQTRHVEKLDFMLGRAQFAHPLSREARDSIRRCVTMGVVSPWTALSLGRSFGCYIPKDGGLAPSPPAKVGLLVGSAACCVLIVGFIAVACALAVEADKPCVRQCVIVGASQLMVVLAYLAAATWSMSWGRNRAARLLASSDS